MKTIRAEKIGEEVWVRIDHLTDNGEDVLAVEYVRELVIPAEPVATGYFPEGLEAVAV